MGMRLDRTPIRTRRGTVLVAVLIAMVVVQLAVVGAVLGGARDQDLTVLRIEGARAFYAAEAGANMAMREWITQTDADGDGGVGTISNDGNENNDPALGNARFNVAIGGLSRNCAS